MFTRLKLLASLALVLCLTIWPVQDGPSSQTSHLTSPPSTPISPRR